MNPANRRSASVPGNLPAPVLWVSSLMYLGLLCAGIYYNLAGLCGAPLDTGRLGLFVGALAFLLALERIGPPSGRPARHVAVGLLALRMLVFAGVASVDCSGLSQTLYLLIPFSAYFYLGKRASYGLAALYLVAFLARLWLAVPDWYLDREALSDLLMFCLGLLFAISMAGVAADAEAQRARTALLLADLELSHQQLKASAGQVAELAAAEERNRLARDIHDSLGHYLTAVGVQLEKAIAFRQRNPQEAEQALWDARRSARQALQDVRQSVSSLRHADEPFALAAALHELVRHMGQVDFKVDLQISGEEHGFPRLVLLALYRAAQEGLTNVHKHAGATRVTLCLALDEHEARLTVADDGCGFDPAILAGLPMRRQEHFGLQGVQERLELVEGAMHIVSGPEQGTQLRITIPKYPRTLGRAPAPRSADAA